MEPQFDDQLTSHQTATSEVAEAAQPTREPGGAQGLLSALQRQAGNRAVARAVNDQESEATMVRRAIDGGGAPLDKGVRSPLEQRMGADFSNVRIHTGSEADASAKAISANAYTVGDDIVFRSGHYAPDQSSGLKTLAHELTHVVQQRSGPVDGESIGGGMQMSSPSDPFEQEAEANGERIAGEGGLDELQRQDAVQREGEEEEELQAESVQRDEMEEEELQAESVQREGEEEEELQAEHIQREGEEEEELQAEHIQREEMEEEEMQM